MSNRREFLKSTATVVAAALAANVTAAGEEKMSPPGKDQLISSLKAAGQSPQLSIDDVGTTVMVLPNGGRILGLFSPDSQTNFLWTNDHLRSADSARAFIESDEWQNTGGDRTWLSPEIDFFYPNFPVTDPYFQPRSLDPGNYQLIPNPHGITVRNDLNVRSYRHKVDWQLRLTKDVRLLSNPLSRLPHGQFAEKVQFAGYRLHTSLEILAADPKPADVNIWNLVQMPNGGDMIIPTYYRSEPTTFFGDIPAGHVQTYENKVVYTMKAEGEQKIAVSAMAATGRAGYIVAQGDETALIIRNFAVRPSANYVDVWPTSPEDDGYAFQACNIRNPTLGTFSELEYHAPAIGGETGLTRSDDVSELWAFRGDQEIIRSLGELLLSAGAS